jgi:MFS transporter, DHA1 family, multidrug resistance protein
MNRLLTPELWLLVLIIGLPQLSETVYTPALPDIGSYLQVSDNLVEYTLSIYLFGFAIGTLFWGNFSDKVGRKPCLLLGLLGYVIGCIGCYFSTSLTTLMISRFVQAFGGSTGSVIGQAICRDVFQGKAMGKAFSVIGGALAFSPALGPVIGGMIDQAFGWSAIFLILMALGMSVLICTLARLEETHLQLGGATQYFLPVFQQLSRDYKAIGYAILIAACNGIVFSYYAEGSFYLMDLLQLSPVLYGLSFLGLACAGFSGAWLSKRLHDYWSGSQIIKCGIYLVLLGSGWFLALTLVFDQHPVSREISILLTLTSMMVIQIGNSLIIPNCLSVALISYRSAIGTASSIFGFGYYTLISLFTVGMGALHNDTLLAMPAYFFGIGIVMWAVFHYGILTQSDKEEIA